MLINGLVRKSAHENARLHGVMLDHSSIDNKHKLCPLIQ